jgi:hypothetical protein
MIPLIIMHLGNQPYFQKCVELNTKFNDVILIGDQSNLRTFTQNPKVKHYHTFNLETDDTRDFRRYFKNYSTNSYDSEYTCFIRYFHYITIMDELGIDKIAVCDSDCLMLEDVNLLWPVLMPPDAEAGMPRCANVPEMFDTACNSAGFLTRAFCVKFVEFIREIYLSQSKFDIIESKIRWHAINEIPGGISDMTILTAMWDKGIANIVDLAGTQIYENEVSAFDWNIQSAAGFNGKNTYAMLPAGVKYAKKKMGENGMPKFYFATTEMEYIRALTMHFQGIKCIALLETFTF